MKGQACRVSEWIRKQIRISYHIVDFIRQLTVSKFGTDKPKLEVKMQSVSDDDVWKRLLEQSRFECNGPGTKAHTATSHALGGLAGSRRTPLHMQQRWGTDVLAAVLKV